MIVASSCGFHHFQPCISFLSNVLHYTKFGTYGRPYTDSHEGFHCLWVLRRLHLLHCLKGRYQRENGRESEEVTISPHHTLFNCLETSGRAFDAQLPGNSTVQESRLFGKLRSTAVQPAVGLLTSQAYPHTQPLPQVVCMKER